MFFEYQQKYIFKKLKFQNDCPHKKTFSENKEILTHNGDFKTQEMLYCKRCGKLLNQK